jgi:phosphoglycolate phosphatase
MNQSASPFSESRFKVKAVLIDLDGTLIDSAPEIAKAASDMLTVLKLPKLSIETVQSFIGEGALALIKRCLKTALQAEPDEALIRKAQKHFFALYSKNCIHSKPYPKVVEGLIAVQKLGLPLACVTNKPAIFTEPMLKATGLFDYFDEVISGDTLPKKKPEPDQIFHACKAFKVDPWHAVLIGDSNTDILAAKNAGCYVFTVPYGYNQGLKIDENAIDAMIQDLSEATNHIQTEQHND